MHCKQNSIESKKNKKTKKLHVRGASQLSTQVVENGTLCQTAAAASPPQTSAGGRPRPSSTKSLAGSAAFDGQTAAKSASLVTVVILLSLSLTTIRPS